MPVRGIRGATVAEADHPEAILSATRDLLKSVCLANPSLRKEDIASVLFTVTNDLQSCYPAQAARQLGWDSVPLMCALEIPVPGSLSHCIRVLIHWNTDLPQEAIRPVYLGAATSLRPDIDRTDSLKTQLEVG
jgi:chorismate mutase